MSTSGSAIFLLSVFVLGLFLIWGVRHVILRTRRLVRSFLHELRTIHHDVRTVAGEVASLDEGFAELNRSIKTQLVYQKPIVKELLAALQRSGNESGQFDPSYGLSRIMAALAPRLTRGKSSDTIVCTLAVGDRYRDNVQPCLESQRQFAEKHGFSYCVLEKLPAHADRPIAWYKIPLIAQLLAEGYEKVLYIDADAMVTNPDFKIGPLFDRLRNDQKPLLITEDGDGINAGVMLFQKTNAAFVLLDLIWLNDADIHNGLWEQHALKSLMDTSKDVSRAVAIELNPKIFNSFPLERSLFHPTRPNQIWSRHDFLCHFSGIRSPHLERYIADYAKVMARESVSQTRND